MNTLHCIGSDGEYKDKHIHIIFGDTIYTTRIFSGDVEVENVVGIEIAMSTMYKEPSVMIKTL